MRKLATGLTVLILLGACGSSTPETAAVAPERAAISSFGAELFEERVVGANPGCVTCHSLLAGVTLVGPSLFGVTSPLPGLDDAEYLRQSIVDPDAYVVDGFSAGQMNGGWADLLSAEQIDSLVDFLLDQN